MNNYWVLVEVALVACAQLLVTTHNNGPAAGNTRKGEGSYNKPVKVVLCGVFGKINKDYLKLARDTKGSIHLIEEDIYTLAELKEGETIKIHGVTYKLVKGEFIDVTPVSL